ncbi:hypothetical protein I302_105928 [Kwoniella bestiolae CBS 10118]|uniref:HhH-GPD domain-containing protein n=1 Tax=Kwoniella bestiolae CBS 10118 TaxID=1296100 RepID=A0A1B9G2J1_9TREE|nr:hypothetical protein I302_05052 [Kwoniella bestiolae CBS 10118]OCF25239.1 hypothetical protein I302_05052 [Kwoniella bestiolae CBS 10118]
MLRALDLLGKCEYEYLRYQLYHQLYLDHLSLSDSESVDGSSASSPTSTTEDTPLPGEAVSQARLHRSPYFGGTGNMKTRSQSHHIDKGTNDQVDWGVEDRVRMITPPCTPLTRTRRSVKKRTDVENGVEGMRPPTPDSLPNKKRKRTKKEVVVEIPSMVEVELKASKGSKSTKKKKKNKGKDDELKDTAKIDGEEEEEEVIARSERGLIERIGKIHLIQEKLRFNPWKMLIATSLLNKTSGRAVRPILEELLARYPTPQHLAEASIPDLSQLLYPLGLYNQRASSLVRFSRQYLDMGWPLYPITTQPLHTEDIPSLPLHPYDTQMEEDGRPTAPDVMAFLDSPTFQKHDVKVFHGSGIYASDSFRIFSQFYPGGGAPRDEKRWLGRVERAKRKMREGEGKGWDGSVAMLSDHLSDGGSSPRTGKGEEEEEWRKVVPLDKELRRYLIWRWGIEGIVYDIHTGPILVKERDQRRLSYLIQEKDS